MVMKTYKLSNGMEIPAIGFGCYDPDGEDSRAMFRTAMEVGYRYFDTASFYETERALGAAIKDSQIPRNELQIATKVWLDELGYESTKEALKRSLDRLQLDYVDMYIIHWPRPYDKSIDWKQLDIDTWRAMEEMHDEGLIKGLGLSNFFPHHLDNILANCKIKPVVDQVELHPGYSQNVVVDHCKKNAVLPQAWSPLGRRSTLEDPRLKEVAAKYGVTVAQLSIQFLLQMDVAMLLKSATKSRMEANLNPIEFTISDEDMIMLTCMQQDLGCGEHPDFNMPQKSSNRNQ